jgi:hypothetical protein
MTIDDFEWVERGFDEYALMHKTHELTLAVIHHFGGWKLLVLIPVEGRTHIAETIDNLETAKVIAAIHVNRNMGDYPDATLYRTRALRAGPRKIPKGVFKMD